MNKEAFLDRFAQNEPSNVPDFFRSGRKKIFYGQGIQAKYCYDMMCHRLKLPVIAFIGGGGERHPHLPRDVPFYPLLDFSFEKSEYDVLLALNEKHNSKVLPLLKREGWEHLYYSDDWHRTNRAYEIAFFECFLEKYNVNPKMEIIEKGNFRILGIANQLEEYSNIFMANAFFDIIATSIFGCEDYVDEGSYECGAVQIGEQDIVLDLGANFGLFSCVAASKGGKVYAFEPTPRTLLFLKKNAALYKDIHIEEYAVSDKEGEVFFNVNDMTGSNISLEANTLFSELVSAQADLHMKQIKVKSITLDSFVRERGLDRVDFIKADIEGAERYMLAGAKEVLSKFAPKLALCIYHRPDDKEVMTKLIMEANPAYQITYGPKKLYAWVEK